MCSCLARGRPSNQDLRARLLTLTNRGDTLLAGSSLEATKRWTVVKDRCSCSATSGSVIHLSPALGIPTTPVNGIAPNRSLLKSPAELVRRERFTAREKGRPDNRTALLSCATPGTQRPPVFLPGSRTASRVKPPHTAAPITIRPQCFALSGGRRDRMRSTASLRPRMPGPPEWPLRGSWLAASDGGPSWPRVPI